MREHFMHQDGWFYGWDEDFPGANSQERTLIAARKSLDRARFNVLRAYKEMEEKEKKKQQGGKI